MGNVIANRIVEGRILEILGCRAKGGATIYEITKALNKSGFKGAVGNWFKHGFSSYEVRQKLNRLNRAGIVRLYRVNGNRFGLWHLNGGVKPLVEPRKNPTVRKMWGLAFNR